MTNPYLTSRVMTADRGQLLLMLYDGAIRFNDQAISLLENQQKMEAFHPMRKALAIIQELQNMLDAKHAPELCSNLERLYIFIQDQVLEAQQKKDPKPLRNAGKILKDLRESWSQAIQKVAASTPDRRVG
jgi:flagellar protein FliS